MSLSVEGQKCPVCGAYLFDDEDIVFCPTCGAPHHRECYMHLGHCALEADHGTDRQYDANKAAEEHAQSSAEQNSEETPKYRCFRCGSELGDDEKVCKTCGAPRINSAYGPQFGFGFREPQWKGETEVEDGITLSDVVPIVAVNAHRYSQKFIMLNKKHRSSWNWAAFLLPSAWSFYRKNFTSGILMGLLQVAATLLQMPVQQLMNTGILSNRPTYAEIFSLLAENPVAMWLSIAGAVLMLSLRIFSGLFGDYIYRSNCIAKAKKIKTAPENEKEMLRYKLGGVSPMWFMIAVMAETYIPSIIAMFL